MGERVFGTPPENERQYDPRFRTTDRVVITDGLRVWDYDWKSGTVDFARSNLFGSEHWDGWFHVRLDDGGSSTMDGTRLRTIHWSDGRPPPVLRYGLREPQLDTLLRLACAAADEYQQHPERDDHGSAYRAALASFSDPDVVHALAVRTWRTIENE